MPSTINTNLTLWHKNKSCVLAYFDSKRCIWYNWQIFSFSTFLCGRYYVLYLCLKEYEKKHSQKMDTVTKFENSLHCHNAPICPKTKRYKIHLSFYSTWDIYHCLHSWLDDFYCSIGSFWITIFHSAQFFLNQWTGVIILVASLDKQ